MAPEGLIDNDPFTDDNLGSVPAAEYRETNSPKEIITKMARQPLANVAQPVLSPRPKLSAYAENGKYTPLRTLEGKLLEIQSTEMIDTKYGPALQMNLIDPEGVVHQVCTSAVNIVTAFEAFNEDVAEGTQEYPIEATFNKIALDGGNTCWVIE